MKVLLSLHYLFSFFYQGTRAIEGLALELNRTDVCQVELRTSGFSRMHKLRLLKLDNVRLNGGYEKKLEWLCWHRCPLKALPKGFPSTSLVAIEMQRSKLQKMCHGSMVNIPSSASSSNFMCIYQVLLTFIKLKLYCSFLIYVAAF